jgi:hypothetical protein
MNNYTLTYDDGVQGWPSFYSYYPDWMIGMNQFFYTFKGGNLYRHNANVLRNTFYEDWWVRAGNPSGAFTPSKVISVFNDAPLENKLFKTLNLESDHAWSAALQTDIQTTGFINANWFEKKEASWFAFVRNQGTIPANAIQEFPLRSLNGIGRSSSINPTPANAVRINFSINPLVDIGSIISIGDSLYNAPPPFSSPIFIGRVTNVVRDYPGGNNYIIVNTSVPGGNVPTTPNAYYLFIKNAVAESHGVLGHYCLFTIENGLASKTELFAVESDVMKSFP